MQMKVLAISSSRVGSGGFLENAMPLIREFISNSQKIAFVPFASVQRSYDEYAELVKKALSSLANSVDVVEPANAGKIIEQSDVIMVGGGNTFKLLHDIYDLKLFDLIQNKIQNGTTYIGWSAGANIAGKSIKTTNDMPIIQPWSFTAFGFFPFQINPHYFNQQLDGHNGETRDQRLEEFIMLNPKIPVVGLPEGSALKRTHSTLQFISDGDGTLFQADENNIPLKKIISKGEDLSLLLSGSMHTTGITRL
jgi:dipeptidase E